MSNDKLIQVKFSAIERVHDKFVRVRTLAGKAVTVTAPHDSTLKVNSDGEGHVICPRYMAEA